MYCKVCIFLIILTSVKLYKIEVNVKQGKIVGAREATVFEGRLYFAFYRIPYAQAPVKELRFKDPKPPIKWDRPYDARTVYNGACAQAHIVHKHGTYGVEDCLYLNIYTPNLPNENADLKPVIVWIHGYAFTSSFSHIHGADFLLENDVVLVTLSHRIGVFGFFKPNDTDPDGNMGLKDIVMGLKWIRRNIKEFGGDKKRITVMSSSSAATFVSLLIMTEAKNMFSKMILQSGSIFSPSIFQGDNEIERLRLIENLNKRDTNLKNATTKDIIMASLKIYTRKEMENFQKPVVPFSPIVEIKSNTSLLTMKPETFEDIHFNKPILIGFNTQESISEIIPFIHNPSLINLFMNKFKFMVPFNNACSFNYNSNNYMSIARKIKERYFKARTSENTLENFVKYTSDLIKYPILKFIKSQKKNKPMFVYKFDYKGVFNAVKTTSIGDANVVLKGAANGDEICYILKCEPLWETYGKLRKHDNSTDRAFIKKIASLWSNFVKYSNPTPSKYLINVTWPAMTPNENNMLFIGRSIKIIDFHRENSIYKFWDNLYDKYYKNKSRDEL